MKLISLAQKLFILFSIFFTFSNHAFADNFSAKIMKQTSKISQDGIMEGFKYETGVAFSPIKRTPKFSAGLVRKIKQLEQETISTYIKALKDEDADLNCTLKEALEDIRLCLSEGAIQIGVRYVAELNGQAVGYALELYDHADAAIIQDGSWIIIYLDLDMNIVAIYKGQS